MAVSEEECSSAKSRSSSSTSSSTYYLAKCVLRGSVVLQVLYGHIRSPSSLDVVFGKVCIVFFPLIQVVNEECCSLLQKSEAFRYLVCWRGYFNVRM
ncbi:hypothetical protein Csa_017312 [Cucumis sativus]|nr:hypothetical protein Csa_017312 [Cucumis sativus]